MSKEKRVREELVDQAEKLLSAQEAAAKPGASARSTADLKIIEQQFQAEQQKADRLALRGERPAAKPATKEGKREKKLDDALRDSFPGSDPVSLVEPAPVKDRD